MRAHLVWDWNGTLFDDTHAVVGASNAAFAEYGPAPLTVAEYRELYRIPVIDFYQDRLGRRPSPEEWERMDAVFHERYEERRDECLLAPGAAELLTARGATESRTQSLLSMYEHAQLVPLVGKLGLSPHFVRIDGRDGTSGVSGKGAYLERHLRLLADRVDPARTVLIGDVPDDAHAAAQAGIKAVLHTGGSAARRELERVGVPVADSLTEAVAIAEGLTAH